MVVIVNRSGPILTTTHLYSVAQPILCHDTSFYLAVSIWLPLPIPDLDAAVQGWLISGRSNDLAKAIRVIQLDLLLLLSLPTAKS